MLIPYTITAIERDEATAELTGKQVIVGATFSMYELDSGDAVTLYDDAAGSNGSTAKTTGTNGQVTVYIEPGRYRQTVNSITSYVTVGESTTLGTAAGYDVGTGEGQVLLNDMYGIGYRAFTTYSDWDSIPADYRGFLRLGFNAANAPDGVKATEVYHGMLVGNSFSPMLKIWAAEGARAAVEYIIEIELSGDDWESTPTYTLKAEYYHSENTNFNRIGGSGTNDQVLDGSASSATVARFKLRNFNMSQATGLTIDSGSFEVVNSALSVVSTGQPSVNVGLSSLTSTVIDVAVSGVTLGDPLILRCSGGAAYATINY